MNRIDTNMPLGIHRDLVIVAIVEFIWGLGEGLFIFFLPLALQRWNMDAVQIGAVLSIIGDQPEAVYIASLGASKPNLSNSSAAHWRSCRVRPQQRRRIT